MSDDAPEAEPEAEELSPLNSAQEQVRTWWAEREPLIQPRKHARQGLVYQVQRDALAKAQAIAALTKLGADDTNLLIVLALGMCRLGPRFDG